jgi:hypothetical protein
MYYIPSLTIAATRGYAYLNAIHLGTPITVELNFSMEPQWPKKVSCISDRLCYDIPLTTYHFLESITYNNIAILITYCTTKDPYAHSCEFSRALLRSHSCRKVRCDAPQLCTFPCPNAFPPFGRRGRTDRLVKSTGRVCRWSGNETGVDGN